MKPTHTSSMIPLIGLSLATSPFIISILMLNAVAECFQSLGKFSEEAFRADQLPLLNFNQLNR